MKTAAAATIFVAFLALGSSVPTNRKDAEVTDAINGFGIELYKELSKTHENLICSGYSISTVLNMLLAGSRGQTAREITRALGYNSAGISQGQAEESYQRILTNQRDQQNGYTLDVANSVWIQKDFDVLPEFKSKVQNTFLAREEEVDFSSPRATDTINDWVNRATQNKIPKLFDRTLDATTIMVLVNAMYFKGEWETKFEKDLTKDHPFTYANGNVKRDIPMMKMVSHFPYHESEELDAQILELPYEGDDVSMVIVLPKTVNGLRNLHDQLSLEKLKTVLVRLYEEKVTVTIPKFESSSTLELNDVLQSLGIKEAFSPNADLSGIDGTQNLYVSRAVQKATIEVSEEGTVAAAASGIEIQFKTLPIHPPKKIVFTADHPFLYFIRHRPTGLLLFLGSKTTP